MGRLTVRLGLAAQHFILDHRHSGLIHLHIENWNRLADNSRYIQLDSLLHFFPLPLRDIFSDGFRGALHRLGGHFQTGQDFHLFAAAIEGSILAHQGMHAAHAGREPGVLDVQFHVGRKLSLVTMRAQVVWARDLHLAHHRQHRLGT